jgi:signal transduction histidine kinase
MAQTPAGTSLRVGEVLKVATEYMNKSSYDSAQFVVSAAFSQTNFPLNPTDLYYLHCYESEIMYYNALFEQGLNSSMRGAEIAKELNDSNLLGNTENLVGLFEMNLAKNKEALPHFKKAIALISPTHNNDWLSYRYHALANLGECYFKLNMPDSAIYYSNQSIEEAQRRNRIRGISLAKWNIAESYLLQNKIAEARQTAMEGFSLVSTSVHRDAVQQLCATLMKVHNHLGQSDSVHHWMEVGFVENNHTLNTDFSRIQFLQQAIEQCILLKDIDKGSELLQQLNLLQRTVSNKEQTQRVNILKDYYEKNQKLLLAQELNGAQQKELSLRKTVSIVFGILTLLLVLLFFIAMLVFRQRQRITQLQHKQQLQTTERELELKSLKSRMAAVADERNRIASDLHDDVGASLSSINIYSRVAMEKINQSPKETNNLLQQISSNATDMMDSLSDIVWSINPKNDTLASLLNRVKIHSLEVLNPLDITVNFKHESDTDVQLGMTARKNIFLIAKEAINNISKHSNSKVVTIYIKAQNDRLTLEFDDDGVGIAATDNHSGNGLNNLKQRTEELGGTISITSQKNSGTKVIVEFSLTRISDISLN